MKISKTFKCEDNIERTWTLDGDNNMIIYSGLAKDFQNIKSTPNSTAKKLIIDICKEEGLRTDNIK